MRKNIFLFAIIAVISAAVGAYFALRTHEPVAAQQSASAAFFTQTFSDAQGNPQALSQHRGKILIVNFWATWCPPCVEEMPELVALQKEWSDQNVQIIGIGVDSAANISEFSLKHRIDYPLYVAGMNGSELSREFGNRSGGLPFTVLIKPDGQIGKTYLGRLKMDELQQDLKKL
jgi:thiol-disulfide isomerase/thioredoxin